MTRILIADDHDVIRQGIRRILTDAANDVLVVGEATSGHELLACARAIAHDLVLLDLSMPGMAGLDVLKRLKRERPVVPVLIVTMHAEEAYGFRARNAGASGYLLKEAVPTQLVHAIRTVMSGGQHFNQSTAETIAVSLTGQSKSAQPSSG